LADLTAALASVASSADDPVLAWPPLHPLRPLHAFAPPVSSSSAIIDSRHWGYVSRRPADSLVPLLPPAALPGVEAVALAEPVELSD